MLRVFLFQTDPHKNGPDKNSPDKKDPPESAGADMHSPRRPSSRNKEGALILLRAGLRAMGVSAPEACTPEAFSRTKDGKPHLPGLPGVHFNYSHSGGYIACAFSDQEVGLDLQEHANLPTQGMRIARRFYTALEFRALQACHSEQEQEELFFRLWTIKEAYLKYIGCGLRGSLDSFLPESIYAFDSSSADIPAPFPAERGRIHILSKPGHEFLTPAEYAVLPAPAGYTMTVSALSLPEKILIQEVRRENGLPDAAARLSSPGKKLC